MNPLKLRVHINSYFQLLNTNNELHKSELKSNLALVCVAPTLTPSHNLMTSWCSKSKLFLTKFELNTKSLNEKSICNSLYWVQPVALDSCGFLCNSTTANILNNYSKKKLCAYINNHWRFLVVIKVMLHFVIEFK